ncbi:MAG TPA: hypothetical protein VKV80_07940 [Streptosporangiaceae bacterium]|nr:hypothetical protein [Streptosporangiaceae bacterium]
MTGEDQARVLPGIPGAGAVGVLLLLAELERSDAQVRQRQRSLGGFGLDRAPDETPVDTLKLLSDIQLGGIEVDSIPGEPEHFALAQVQHEDEDVGRVEGVMVATSGLQAA